MTTIETMRARAKELTLEELEHCDFMVDMVDRWSSEDWEWKRILTEEIRKRKAER